MISSKKAAYIANGADLDQPFEDNELLNRKDDFPFEDPPWRVLDTEATFEPMEIKAAPVDTPESDDAVEADLDAEQVNSDPEIAESEESPESIQDVSLEETDKEMS
ncbi:MAG: hypothetical protein ACPH5O_05535, partial [Litorivicinaceae bacterium]